MQCLKRIDQHASNITTRRQHVQRIVVHFLERVSIARRDRITRAGLHVFPPAMVRTAKSYQMRFLRVVARQPHRLHDRLSTGHMEGDLIETGDALQPRHVVDHTRMVATEYRPERLNAFGTFGDGGLVEVNAKHIDTIRACQVVEDVAIEVCHGDATCRCDEAGAFDVLAKVRAVLIRHSVSAGELQIRDADRRLRGGRERAGKVAAVVLGEHREAGTTSIDDVVGRAVGVEEGCFVVGVAGQQLGHTLGHS